MQPDMIIVGAGPVGLFTAIQAKLYDPNLNILMLEKHPRYTRDHSLLIDHSSFQGAHPGSDFQAFIKAIPSSIRTNDLEDSLLEYAKKLSIEIEFAQVVKPKHFAAAQKRYPNIKTIRGCDELVSLYPSAKFFVGADGSHSVMRKEMFDNQYQVKKVLKNIAEIKYKIAGEGRALSTVTETIPVTTYANHLVSEFVGRKKDGISTVGIRFFIEDQTYAQMKEATFQNPMHLNDKEKIEPALFKSIMAWLIARETLTDEKRIPESEKITVTNLPVYASKNFVKQEKGKYFFLVGDAAFGVPYFRSLNNGIFSSSKLAKTIHAIVNHITLENSKVTSFNKFSTAPMTPQAFYQNALQQQVDREVLFAELKTYAVRSLESSAATMRSVPLPRAKLIFNENGRLYKRRMQTEYPEPSSSSSFEFFKTAKTIADETSTTLPHTSSKKMGNCNII